MNRKGETKFTTNCIAGYFLNCNYAIAYYNPVLTAFEIENVSGAGWLQDGLAALGSKVGAAAWTMGTDALSINLPLLGTLNLADLAPDLGKTLGESVGSTIGGTIESALAGLPVIGGLLNKLLGN